eukprot:950710-Rhodomonas_salina.2
MPGPEVVVSCNDTMLHTDSSVSYIGHLRRPLLRLACYAIADPDIAVRTMSILALSCRVSLFAASQSLTSCLCAASLLIAYASFCDHVLNETKKADQLRQQVASLESYTKLRLSDLARAFGFGVRGLGTRVSCARAWVCGAYAEIANAAARGQDDYGMEPELVVEGADEEEYAGFERIGGGGGALAVYGGSAAIYGGSAAVYGGSAAVYDGSAAVCEFDAAIFAGSLCVVVYVCRRCCVC